MLACRLFCFFFFNAASTTEIYTLSLHDALPICEAGGIAEGAVLHAVSLGGRGFDGREAGDASTGVLGERVRGVVGRQDRKSTRLNSSHRCISYAVFCLKKKKKINYNIKRLEYQT